MSGATALYLALLQFLFNLCWVVYAIYLPTLAGNIGIAAGTVILILMMDQAIFTVFDIATGIGADRMSRIIGKVGRSVAIVTLVSVHRVRRPAIHHRRRHRQPVDVLRRHHHLDRDLIGIARTADHAARKIRGETVAAAARRPS